LGFTRGQMAQYLTPFPISALTAKTKLLLLGSDDFRQEEIMNRARSLQLEHVSPAGLMRRGISRSHGPAAGTRPPSWRSCAAGSSRANLMRDSSSRTSRLRCSKLKCSTNGSTPATRKSTRRSPARRPRAVVGHYRTLGLLNEAPSAMMIPIKDKDGIARMREACAIAATVLESLKPLVRPGITTMDLEEAGRAEIARHGSAQRLLRIPARFAPLPGPHLHLGQRGGRPRNPVLSSASCARATSSRSTSSSNTTATSVTTPSPSRRPVAPRRS
jgi:hypothetical protein